MSQGTLEHKGPLIPLTLNKRGELAEQWLRFASRKIAGQPRLVEYFALMLEESCARFSEPHRPLGVILIPGPSGAGKTLCIQIFAEFLLKNKKGFIRIDGQDYSYSNRHMITRITGSPPGYKDHEKEPIITQYKLDQFAWELKFDEYYNNLTVEQRRQNNVLFARRNILLKQFKALEESKNDEKPPVPKNVPPQPTETIESIDARLRELGYPWYDPENETYLSILFIDELGRGDKELHNLMYKIFDEGEIVSAREETTSFKNTFICMTDNAGSEKIADLLRQKSGDRVQIGIQGKNTAVLTPEQIDQRIYHICTEELRKRFETPFLNRIDYIAAARPHTRESLCEVLEIQISELVNERLLKQKCPLMLVISAEVKQFIVEESMDNPEENARVLVRKFNHHIVKNLRRLRVTKQIEPGDHILASLETVPEKQVVFHKIPREKKIIMPPKI